ncbi:MAG: hypothetical protein JWP27_842 [Flaviaesturariibacter sp.]|nr:hypothetical protein [Flaviaesturariibacter sp.]
MTGKLFLIYLDTIAPFLTLLVFAVRMRLVLKERVLSLLFLYLLVQLVLNGTANLFSSQRINSHPFFHLNIFLSFFLVTEVYRSLLPSRHGLIGWLRVAYVGATALNLLTGGSIYRFNSFGFSVASLLVMALSLLYFLQVIREPTQEGLSRQPRFWINVGFFTYFTTSFFVFITYDYFTRKGIKVGYLWRFHNVMLTLLCTYLITGLLCSRSDRKY